MGRRTKRWINTYGPYLGIMLGVILYPVLTTVLGIGCPIQRIFGISCGGCGMTRAWLAAVRFQWANAFAFHPLFWTVPLVIGCLLVKRKYPRIAKIGVWIWVIAMLIVYVFRLLDPVDAVVVFAPQEGLIGRGMRQLITWLQS